VSFYSEVFKNKSSIMLSKLNQAQKVKGHMFFLCISQTCKLCTHNYVYYFICTQIYSERENKILFVDLSGGTSGDGRVDTSYLYVNLKHNAL
jgi:hypothetical protein